MNRRRVWFLVALGALRCRRRRIDARSEARSRSGWRPWCRRARCGTKAFSTSGRSGAGFRAAPSTSASMRAARRATRRRRVRKVNRGQLQAVALSSVGLSRIDSGVACLQLPLLLDSYAELDYVRDRVAAALEQRIEAKGFKVLNWADGGWVYAFAEDAGSDAGRPARARSCSRRPAIPRASGSTSDSGSASSRCRSPI